MGEPKGSDGGNGDGNYGCHEGRDGGGGEHHDITYGYDSNKNTHYDNHKEHDLDIKKLSEGLREILAEAKQHMSEKMGQSEGSVLQAEHVEGESSQARSAAVEGLEGTEAGNGRHGDGHLVEYEESSRRRNDEDNIGAKIINWLKEPVIELLSMWAGRKGKGEAAEQDGAEEMGQHDGGEHDEGQGDGNGGGDGGHRGVRDGYHNDSDGDAQKLQEAAAKLEENWEGRTFSAKKFADHYGRHSSDWSPPLTEEQCVAKARELLSAPPDANIEGFVSESGQYIFKYNNATNEFAIGRSDGLISTFYKPKTGRAYWLEQIEEHGGNSHIFGGK